MLEIKNIVETKENHSFSIEERLFYTIVKRVIDILGATVGLILLIPVFLLVGIMLKTESPKSDIFFCQNRVGKKGKIFKMYKFRSMVADAESKLDDLLQHNEVQGAMFKMKEDPRVTKIGKKIRKTSIDEFPQLWNVLKGEMSLVGPRPPLEREVAEYTDYDKLRLQVKPGCTGLWQVSGRNDLGFDEMVKLDLKYIRKQSIIYDIKIIFKTVTIIIKPNSGY